ncbi:MAG: hypothetical protein JRC86_05285, partial [Deltaproteobacteria bacterium]|nr:hypothetical protein [Deltaproteobacteria bacterium]
VTEITAINDYSTNYTATGQSVLNVDNPPFYFDQETAGDTDWWMGVPSDVGGTSDDKFAVGIAVDANGFGDDPKFRIDPNGVLWTDTANDPNVVAIGETQYDADDFSWVSSDGSNKFYTSGKVKSFAMTIYDPNVIELADPNVPILPCDPNIFSNGITIISLGIKTSATNTCTVTFTDYNSPTDASPDTIEAVTLSSGTEAGDDGTLTNSTIAAGSIVYAILSGVEDTSTFLQLWGTYYVNTNN